MSPCSLIFKTIASADGLLCPEIELPTVCGVEIPVAGKSTPVQILYSAFNACKTFPASSKSAYSLKYVSLGLLYIF